jgi:hypothetical protein
MLKGWADIVGEAVSRHCWPIRISNDSLLVGVDSSVWMAQLSYYKERIIERFNSKHGCNLRNLHFRLDRREPSLHPGVEASDGGRTVVLDEGEIEWAYTLAARLGDEKLQEVLRRVLLEHRKHEKRRQEGDASAECGH